ncbi:universal stress protein [Acinetobacter sp. S40]|uniref:universal stress protein n=1 Tax=unclassified Acinetobacter TaxID=196816 RepID=UPI00190A070F|nr:MULTISPECIES: universal stress protein [unclassified Acinetobacter]MBJ9985402.1 universal stress protein [Acinetobacter sp. S40]MBK0063752.1 universal stress protein [Acinetobacter sp. S55]MBK0066959.1 universal stress protein [Acinetobacter sp. S54]
MSYQHILVPVDGSPTSLAAVNQAANLAKTYSSQVTLLLVITIDPFIGVEYINAQNQKEDALNHSQTMIKGILDEAKQKFADQGIDAKTKVVEGQEIYKEIVKAATDLNADLVVIGSHGRTGIKKLVLGSVAQKVLGEVHVPVLVVRE